MSYFDLDTAGTESIRQNARLNPINPGDMGPGFWTGSGTATVKGLAQGIVAQPALLLADTVTPALMPGARKIDDLFGGIGAEDWLKSEQQKTVAAVHGLMPGPQTGLLGQLGYGFGSIVPQATAGFVTGGPAGSAAIVGALQAYSAKRIGETYEGLDENTATLKGAIEGAFAAAGVALPPAFGTGIGTMVATGVLGNVGLGAAQRGSTSALLESQGYDKLAEQYKAFDLSQIAVDAVLGAAFGGIHAKFGQPGEAAKIPPTLTDEVLAENKQNHLQVSVAPGVPADPQSRSLHGRAVDKAMRDIMGDEPVDVSGTGIENAAFVPNRAVQEARVEAAVRADGPPLRTALDEIDQLRARAEELGIVPADEALFEGRRLVDETRDRVEATGARDLPGAVTGRDGEVFVGDRREPVRFVLVEADTLAATIGKADNQFRDRTRAASQQQVAKIANDLQFGRLGEAPTMAEGAPTVAQSGEVVGGNGRVAAVQQAYERGLGEGYRVALEQRAAEFGLTADQVQGFSRPILVRQFTNPVDVRTAAILSNESAGLRMSALEQAKVDAERMPAMPEMPESGDLGAASLRQFVNQWLARYPQGELGEFVDAAGKLSPQGERRLQNAILYRAYGDTPTLARLVEATDDLSRNLSGALVKSAANVAEARDLIASGDLHDLDVQPQLLQAVDTLQRLRESGAKLDDFLAQEDMFGSGVGPEAVLLMQHFQANARSQKAMVAALTGYYDAVRALGDPKQASMFDAQPPSRGALLRAVIEGKKVIEAPAEKRPETFVSAEVENSSGNKVDGLRANFSNGAGGEGVIDLAIVGDRLYPTWVDNGVYGRAEGGSNGAVTRIYRQAIEEAEARGLRFTSDDSVTVEAVRIYDSLARKGYDVVKNPAARLAEKPEVITPRWVTDDGSPVFEVHRSAGLQPEARITTGIDEAKFTVEPVDGEVWLTGAPQEGLTKTRTLAEQSTRANAEEQFAGPGHYISTSREVAALYGGKEGRAYEVEAPFTKAFDFNKVDRATRKSGETLYGEMAERLGGKAAANAWLKEQGYDGIVFTSKRGEKLGVIFNERKLKDVGAAREPMKAPAGFELELTPLDAPLAGEGTSQVLADHPNALVVTETGDALPAGLALQELDAKIATTEADTPGIEAAAACALR